MRRGSNADATSCPSALLWRSRDICSEKQNSIAPSFLKGRMRSGSGPTVGIPSKVVEFDFHHLAVPREGTGRIDSFTLIRCVRACILAPFDAPRPRDVRFAVRIPPPRTTRKQRLDRQTFDHFRGLPRTLPHFLYLRTQGRIARAAAVWLENSAKSPQALPNRSELFVLEAR